MLKSSSKKKQTLVSFSSLAVLNDSNVQLYPEPQPWCPLRGQFADCFSQATANENCAHPSCAFPMFTFA